MIWTVDPSEPTALHEQIAMCVLGAIDDGELQPGERVPPAAEVAAALQVNPNTVLRAYRRLRDQGTLEFRRGRGARVSPDAVARARVVEAATQFVQVGRAYGYTPGALAAIVEGLT
jgi:GntR family transcriptional regulator